ncbi:hypothetical protein HMPREF1861_02295 [Corynebacterium kroppenstedtii]|nr:hypothetical protein HMPREF1861_02295 [Corynebacterium kroppenstedtii]
MSADFSNSAGVYGHRKKLRGYMGEKWPKIDHIPPHFPHQVRYTPAVLVHTELPALLGAFHPCIFA